MQVMVQKAITASNYRYIEDELPQHTALIPYGTMFKEQSKKWQTDDRKVMNWVYEPKEDFYIDPKGVRFNFHAYRQRTDADGFVRDFKEYQAEKRMRTKRSFLKT